MQATMRRSERNVGVLRSIAYFSAAVVVLVAVSWPIVLSFDLWVMKDRGSFLNADYLLDEHLQLGVDTFYAYGLLPIFIQRVAFHLFGRGAMPMIGLTFVYFAAMVVFCALIRRHLPENRIWGIALLALSPIVFWINPTFPYCLVMLSVLYSLLFVLEGRFGIALATAIVGCVSVPSIPIALVGLLVVAIVADWRMRPDRRPADLASEFLPGAIVYTSLVALFCLEFGWRSTLATATPLSQLHHYHAAHYDNVLAYLQLGKHPLVWYFGNRPAWWMFGTAILLFAAAQSAVATVKRRTLDPVDTFLLMCAALHIVFFAFAYGPAGQHVIYDPLLVVGAFVGLARFPTANVRRYALLTFVVLGIFSDAIQVKKTVAAWKYTSVGSHTAGLYADRGWAREWETMLGTYAGKNVLVLSYSTAPHDYFPQIHSPDLWTLNVEQLTSDDRRRLFEQVRAAQVVVEDLTSPTGFIDGDAALQAHLRAMCLVRVTKNMLVWLSPATVRSPTTCVPNTRVASPFGGVRAG